VPKPDRKALGGSFFWGFPKYNSFSQGCFEAVIWYFFMMF
jgi:hypothetical protein